MDVQKSSGARSVRGGAWAGRRRGAAQGGASARLLWFALWSALVVGGAGLVAPAEASSPSVGGQGVAVGGPVVAPDVAGSGITAIGGDDPALRTMFSNASVDSAGEVRRDVYSDPVNFKDDNGDWKPIDSSLVSTDVAGYAAQNAANSFDVLIPDDIDNKPVKVQDDSGWVTFNPAAAAGTPDVTGDSATFDGPNAATSFDYEVQPTDLKESVSLDRAPASAPTYSYALDVSSGLTPKLEGDGSVEIVNGDGDGVYTIPAPTMTDSSANADSGFSSAVSTQLSRDASGWTLTLSPDYTWLSDPARVYPVTIDPTVTPITINASSGLDCWIDQASPTTEHCTSTDTQNNYLYVGQDANGNSRRSLLKFDMSDIPSNANITTAVMSLYVDGTTNLNRQNASYGVKQMLRSWSSNTNWNRRNASGDSWSQPGGEPHVDYDTTNVAYLQNVDGAGVSSKAFDITSLVTGWVNNGVPNYGVMIKQDPENVQNYFGFSSGNQASNPKPVLTVTYTVPTITFVGMSPCQTGCTYPQGGSTWSTGSQLPTFTVDVANSGSSPNDLVVNYTLKDAGTTLLTQSDDVTRDSSTDPFDESTWTVPKPDPNDPTNPYQGLVDGHTYTLQAAVSDPQRGASPPVSVTFQVHKSVQGAFTMFEPLKITDHGAELHWAAYHNNTGDPNNDLYQYQVFRGCIILPNGCANPVTSPANLANTAQWQEITAKSGKTNDTGLDASQRTFTDTTATPSTTPTPNATYVYLVVAQTVADHQAQLNGEFLSTTQNVNTPLAGHVSEVFTGDSPQSVVDHLPLAMLSQGEPTAVVGDPDGNPWFEVGDTSTPSSLKATHAVMQFDTSDIDPDLQVTSAKLQLTQTSGAGTGSDTFEVWNLGQGFDDSTATWTDASDTTVPWKRADGTLSPGGTTSGPSSLDTFTTTSTHKGAVMAAQAAPFVNAVQGWISDPTSNDGLLLKASNDAASTQWVAFDANTAGNSGLQPRLVVDYLATPTPTFRAETMPVRFAPDTTTNVPVTVTNTTSQTWASSPTTPVKLGYWWTDPDGTSDDLNSSSNRTVNIDTLQPGESKTYQLPVVAPENNTTNANHEQSYDLVIDMILPDGTFASLEGGATGAIYAPAYANLPAHYGVGDAKRADTPCLMVGPNSPRPGGLDCLARVVDGTTDPLGLETSLSYTGQPAGAGSQLLVNNHDGDLLWNYDAWQIPSIGPASFVTATYNTQDATNPSGTARGWSFTAGTLNRLGDNPKVSADNKSVTLVDGDGTEHVWQIANATTNTYTRPPGVHLDLAHTAGSSDYDFVRPDGTSFDYTAAATGNTIVPTKIVDHDGNTLTFATNSQGDVTKVTDAAGRDVAALAWDTANGNNHLTSITAPAVTTSTGAVQTRTLQLVYNEALRSSGKDDVTSILDCGNVPTAGSGTYTCPAATAGHLFKFNYCPPIGSCTSNAGPLYSVTDPRGNTSTVSYYSSSDTQEVHTSRAIPTGINLNNWPKILTTRTGRQLQFEYYPATDNSKNIETDSYAQAATYNPPNGQSTATWAETRRLTDPFSRDIAMMDPVNATGHATDSMTSCATAPQCHTTLLVWDADNNAISLTEPGGARTKWTYDPETGYPLKQFDPVVLARGGNPTKLAYVTKTTAAGPAPVVFLKSITTPLGHVTSFTANSNADLASVTDPGANKGTNTVQYDYSTFPMLGAHTAYALQKATDANGNATTFAYDPNAGGATGQPTTVTPPAPDPNNPTEQGSSPTELATSLTYNTVGSPLTTTQGTGTTARQTTVEYDGLWRPVKVTAPGAQGNLPRISSTTYDANGNLATTTKPNNATTSYDYDAADQLTTTHLPGNGSPVADRQQSSVYDIAGNLICSYTPLYTGSRTSTTCATNTGPSVAHSTAYLPDLDGRVFKSIQLSPDGSIATSGMIDPDTGDLTSLTDPRTNTTNYGYDLDHRVVTLTDPATATTRTRYDNDCRVQSTVDADGNPTDYGYYPDGSSKTVTTYRTPAGSNDTQADTTSYQYDHNGNLTKTIMPSGRFRRTLYDQNNNPYEQDGLSLPATAPKDASITYLGYDGFGELARQSLPTAGDLVRPADSGSTFDPKKWTQYGYYASGDIQSSTDPWHIITSYEYNKNGQQTGRTLQGSNPDAQGSNPAGTISVDQSRTMSWSYNADGSLRAHDDTATLAPTVTASTVVLAGGANWQPRSDGTHSLPTYYVHAASSGADTATWSYTPTTSGSMRLQIACPQQSHSGDNPAANATYTITSGSQTHTATLDQSQCDGDQLWYTPNVDTSDNHIPATNGQPVTVTLKTSAAGSVVADNVRFTLPASEGQYAYSYDADGNQIVVNDNTRSPSPVTGAYISCYDDFDRLTKVITTASTATTNGTCSSPSQLSTGYSYDADSNITQVASTLAARGAGSDNGNNNYTATTTYAWDNRNLLASVTASNSLDANASSQTLFRKWSYTYNARGQVATMTKPSVGYTAGNTQVPGNLTSYSYYEDGLLQSSAEVTPGHSTIDSHQLSYDPDGNPSQDMLKIVAPTLTQHQTANYAYDDAGRLKSVSKHDTDAGFNESYQYFADGTINKQTIGSTITTNDEDRGRTTDYQATGATKDFTHYDAFGRLHTVTSGSLTGTTVATYDWDGFDRLVHENTTPNGQASSTDKNTSYDPLDRPTLTIAQQGTNPAKKTRYDYVGLTKQVAAEEQPTSNPAVWQVVKGYTDDPAGHSLAFSKTPIGATSPSTIRYYTLNPHTDTEALTNPSTGAVTQVYRYLAYGNLDTKTNTGRGKVTQGEDTDNQVANASSDNDILNPYRYNDDRTDILTGNYDMGFRTYSTSIGQFLSRDMYNGALKDMSLGLDPWTGNRYAFGGGNPITGIEMDGHLFEDTDGGSQNQLGPTGSGETVATAGEGRTGGEGAGGVDESIERPAASEPTEVPKNSVDTEALNLELEGGTSAEASQAETEVSSELTQEREAVRQREASELDKRLETRSVADSEGATAAETERVIPSVIYREGTPRPGNLTPRPVDNGSLSFRDSLSNPIGSAERPVLRPGEPYIGIDTSRLPSGSVVVDNEPAGHVSVTGVSVEEFLEALIERGKFPK
jgi:RHS repeat-associated protein